MATMNKFSTSLHQPAVHHSSPVFFAGKQQIRKEFERLCQVLGAADCNAEYSSDLDADAFEHLGREILRQPAFETLSPADLGPNAELTSDLARQYLSKQETQASISCDVSEFFTLFLL